MKASRWSRTHCRGQLVLVAATLVVTTTAMGAPIPPAEFTFDVTQGSTLLPGCSSPRGTPLGGICGSEISGPGFAATSGGIGTQSYLPVTPGGTVLGTGTAVDALSNWSSGAAVRSSATMSYSIEATGPASVNFIPINVISTGLAAVAGDGTATLSLVIRDAGTDANIPPGVHDPDPSGPLLDLTATCRDGSCTSNWGTPGHRLTDSLCVVNGDNYVVTISAKTSAASSSRSMNSASAVLEPVVVLDPPYPTSCPVDVSLSELKITAGPGASTGSVPEPSALGLLAIAATGLALHARRRALAAASL
jgi:PEP-CTERM motif